MKIEIEALVNGSREQIWDAWVNPNKITKWNFASEDWCCPKAQVDLRGGGQFSHRMEAKDGSMGFDLNGIYTKVDEHKALSMELKDGRIVDITLELTDDGILVREVFEAENQNPPEMQKAGWQAILNNFKAFVESN